MTPPDSSLSVVEAIMLIMWVIRDLATILTVIAAGGTLLVVLTRSLARKRPRMRGGMIESGIIAWGSALVGCLAPQDRGLFLEKSQVIQALVVSGAGWILAFVIAFLGRSRDI
jgi:hypothetical protein